jgi:hypothetical protein
LLQPFIVKGPSGPEEGEGIEMNCVYIQNPIKETRPDTCPMARVLPFTMKQEERDSTGSQRTFSSFNFIQ